MAEEKVLAQILGELQKVNTRLDSLDTRQAAMEHQLVAFQQFTLERFDRLEFRVERLEVQQTKTNLIVENEIRPAIQILAEGQVMQRAQLDRIEKQVTTHDEIIFKRIK